MRSLPPIYRSIIIDHQAQLKKLVQRAGIGPVKKLYEDMLEEIASKLKVTQSATFGHQQLQGMMAQVRLGLASVQRGIGDAVASSAAEVGVHAARTILTDAARLESHFTGAVIPLPLLEAGRLRGLVDGRISSLMRVHVSSMARYGTQLTGRIESELASSLSMGENHSTAIDRVMKVGDLEWHKAERIVRTEMSFSANASARDASEEMADELDGDMWMRWSEHVTDAGQPLDDRVGVDSEAMNGQVAPPGGMFTQPPMSPQGEAVQDSLVGQQWECPPNRPNDRAVLVPWRASWGIPGWQWEGRRVPVTEHAAKRQNTNWMRSRGRAPDEAMGDQFAMPRGALAEAADESEADDEGDDTPKGTGIGFDSPTVALEPEAPRPVRAKAAATVAEPDEAGVSTATAITEEIPTLEELIGQPLAPVTVRPSVLAGRGWYEPPGLDRGELDRGVGALNAGQPTPVAIGVTKQDHLVVHSGRGHLNAAVDLDHPVRVQWEASEGVRPDHVLRGTPHTDIAHPDVRPVVPPAHVATDVGSQRHYHHIRTGIKYARDGQAATRAIDQLAAEHAVDKHEGFRVGIGQIGGHGHEVPDVVPAHAPMFPRASVSAGEAPRHLPDVPVTMDGDAARAAALVNRPIVPWWYQKLTYNGETAYRDMRKGAENRPLVYEREIVGPDNPDGFVHVWPSSASLHEVAARPGILDRLSRGVAKLFGRK